MSFIITMAVCEGVVMAADRQITQSIRLKEECVNEKMAVFEKLRELQHRPLSKTARKLFTIGDNIGVAMGKAMYSEEGIPISAFVDYFCRTRVFDEPKEAAEKLLEYLCKVGGNIDTILHLAGYNKKDTEQLTLEMYHLDLKSKTYSGGSDIACNYAGYNSYFNPIWKRLNDRETKLMFKYSLQDAVNVAKFAVDMSRFMGRYFDFDEGISDDIEMLAITPTGIQWLLEAKLEVKQ